MIALTPATLAQVRQLPLPQLIRFWDAIEEKARKDDTLAQTIRALTLNDLYYLLVRVCRRVDMLHPWVFARVREVEANPDDHLDLWARGHFKSSIGTFGLTIQKLLRDPELTVGIFSHTRPIAKAFLRQIMREFESNIVLQSTFPDILWGADVRQAPKWSEDDGIILRRKSNPPEASIEAWGLVDGQPTSKHYCDLVYDDIVVEGSVTTPEMLEKTQKGLEQSYNLASERFTRRFYGTRWHFADAYRTIMDRKTAAPRIHPGTDNGTEDGEPVFWSEELLAQKRRDMGPYTFASQVLLNPRADALQGFKREWLRHYKAVKPEHAERMVKYLLVDPASAKKKGSDYTTMWVIGLHTDQNYYALDFIRDRLSLTERADRLFTLHRKYKPIQTRYESYGMQADIEHIRARQETESYRFEVTAVAGQTKKQDRIGRLIPLFEQHRIWLPQAHFVTNYEHTPVDLVRAFVEEEYMAFPVSIHDDMLDSLSRITEPDLTLVWPKEKKASIVPRNTHTIGSGAGWLGN